ncbi:MAG: sigma-70 family RNA polymerase sigma factor [Chitinophagaceae bacterium]|nr:sigma-70 family RNA polymerase sigma factor [Chitinophagaceae bacterium]MCB0740144.1 sigma-70 family RNA polymerase sigma factor [Chitinophagaceae bacterium]HQV07490.1 sigma-70 family RNA polymerase sigma factor [Chitinophagaceae bacterium]
MSSIQKYTEDELVRLLQSRNREAFSYLYNNYSGALHGIIVRLTDNNVLAEDILQEVFLKIWNNISSYDATKGRLFTWMMKIARNLTIDTFRSKGYKKQQKIVTDENFVSNYNDGTSNEKFDSIGISKNLAVLKPEQRLIIDMAYFGGYTQEEISKQTGLPLGTVKTRMRAAILQLRKLLT